MRKIRLFCYFATFALCTHATAQEMRVAWIAGGLYDYPGQSMVSPDGRYLVTSGADSLSSFTFQYIWDFRTRQLQYRLPHAYDIRFTSSGKLIRGNVLWDIKKMAVDAYMDSLTTSRCHVTADEKYWIVQQQSGTILLKNQGDNIPFDSLPAGDLFIAEQEPYILLKLATSRNYFRYNIALRQLTEDTLFSKYLIDNNCTPIRFIKENNLLLRRDSLLRLYDLSAQSQVYDIPTTSRSIRFTPQFSADGSSLQFLVKDTLKVYNSLTGRLLHTVHIDAARYGSVSSFCFWGNTVIIGYTLWEGSDGRRHYFAAHDLADPSQLTPLTYVYGPARASWTHTNQHFVTADFNRRDRWMTKRSNLFLWYSPDRKKVLDIDTNVLEPFSLAPDGDLIAYRAAEDKLIVRDYFLKNVIFSLSLNSATTKNFECMALGYDSLCAVGYTRNNPEKMEADIEVFHVGTGKRVASLWRTYYPYAIRFSPDRKFIAVLYNAGVRIWEMGSWRFVRDFTRGNDFLQDVNFLQDSRYIVFSSSDGYHKVIDIATGTQTLNFATQFRPARRLNTTGVQILDDKYLVASYYDVERPSFNAICIWNIATGKLLQTIEPESPSVASLSISRLGHILTGGHDGTVSIWEPLQFPTEVEAFPVIKESVTAVYPNPALEHITLEFTSEKFCHGTIEIFDAQGQLRLTFLKELFLQGKNLLSIETTTLATGIYHAKITCSNNVQFIKFVIQ
ncbi:MAG TPA: T9SS type A sorting domain-containing protein [Patescibacteria group bacterium]|nr:T9SS type A sorting domain-containing protein [Patescibacteria group bacterium]